MNGETTFLQRRRALRATVCAAGLLLLATGPASAQTYPKMPVKIVVTFPTGGAPDILARLISSNAAIGQPVVVDNRPGRRRQHRRGDRRQGASGRPRPGDGHGRHALHQRRPVCRMPYDMVKDFEPIALIASTPNLLVVNNDLPVKT